MSNYTFKINFEDQIRRILILGSPLNKYSSMSSINTEIIKQYIQEKINEGHGDKILDIVREIYIDGRAPKQDMTFLIHAILCRTDDTQLRCRALTFLKEYRTISQLYMWKSFHSKIPNPDGSVSKGFGRAVKSAINEWILSKSAKDMSYQFTKYIQRGEWGIVNLLKCCHLKTGSGDDRDRKDKNGNPLDKLKDTSATDKDLVLRYMVDGYDAMDKLAIKFNLNEDPVYKYITAIETIKHCHDNIPMLIDMIQEYRLTREQIPTEGLADTDVMIALLTNKEQTHITMPLTALLRNLSNMTRLLVFENKHVLSLVVAYLKNQTVISKARIHPVSILTAWFTYRTGHGKMSKHIWIPNNEINLALEEMFYLSFKNLTPTGKRLCFLIDASGSMTGPSLCDGVSNAEAAALLAMVFSRAEANTHASIDHQFYLFTSGNEGFTDVSDLIHAKASFNDVLNAVQRSNWACTDISKGILNAMKYRRKFDGFVVITDNDVNSGIKPSLALQQYREALNINAQLAVVATQLSDLTIADPEDPGMIDFCGFDSHGPKLLQEFFSGKTSPVEENY
jgi:60 kDa SS-A/Ro ribonucleoprotein